MGRACGPNPWETQGMSKFRPRPKSSHLEVRRIDTPLPFADWVSEMERCLADQPGLGLFADPSGGLMRLGGLGLRGDILIRREQLECEGRLLLASRRGDRAAVEALAGAMGPAMRERVGDPSAPEGLALLNFLQSDLILECARHIEVAGRALEDAFACGFAGLDELRMRLADLNGEAMLGEEGEVFPDCGGIRPPEALPVRPPEVILRQGRRLHLDRVERIRSRRGILTVRAALLRRECLCVVGSLAEEPA
jgi:hypothetical protein